MEFENESQYKNPSSELDNFLTWKEI